jgi:uncharacterized membrane protein YhhN
VTEASRFALTAAVVLAVVNWIAVAQRRRSLEYVAKPAVMVALIVAVAAFDLTDDARRWAFIVALACSLAGDVFLMLPQDRFLFGVAAFFLAHVAYTVGLRLDETSSVALVVGVVTVAAFVLIVGRRIIVAVRDKAPDLATPVSAYIAVISVMVVSAIATRNPWAAAGAVIFMASDTLIAWNRFVQHLPWAAVVIMVTYHVGQGALALSLVRR